MTGNHNCRIRNFQYLKDLTIQGFFVFLCLCRFLMCIFAGKLNIGWLSTSFLGLFMCFGNILCSTDTDYYCCLVFFPLSSSLYLTACYCFCIDVYFPSFLSENSVIIERGFSTRTSYEYELWVNENKVQLMRIRDENGKFRSILPDCPNSIPYSTF